MEGRTERQNVFGIPGYPMFWTAWTVSEFGISITTTALQVLVVLTLHGSAADVGILNASRWLPYLLLGLVLGALVASSPILIGGQSRGGALSVAYAGDHPEQIFGVLNFVGGWAGEGCPSAKAINETLFQRGGRFRQPTLWLYGRGDRFYSLEHSRRNFVAFQKTGGRGTFLEFDVPSGNGHGVIGEAQLWSNHVRSTSTP